MIFISKTWRFRTGMLKLISAQIDLAFGWRITAIVSFTKSQSWHLYQSSLFAFGSYLNDCTDNWWDCNCGSRFLICRLSKPCAWLQWPTWVYQTQVSYSTTVDIGHWFLLHKAIRPTKLIIEQIWIICTIKQILAYFRKSIRKRANAFVNMVMKDLTTLSYRIYSFHLVYNTTL